MMSGKRWIALGCILFVTTFGISGFYFLLYLIGTLAGVLTIACYYGYHQSKSVLQMEPDLMLASPGIDIVKESMEGSVKIKRFDKRITGASVIDDVLQMVLEYTARDYIKNWYREVSDDDKFLLEIRQCVQKVFISFSQRTKDVNWMPYFTQRLVDDFASHIRLYTRAMEKARAANKDERGPLLEQQFFDFEIRMEGDICRDLVSMSPQDERQYLQDLSDVLLFLLLPTEDYNNKPFRYIVREVLVNGIFIPTIDLLSDPDYINSYVAWMCKEGMFTNDTFMTVIRTTDSIGELESVIDLLDCDIAKWRAKDTGGDDDSLVKQNLNSLQYVKTLCEEKIKRLQQGIYDCEFAPDVPEYCRTKSVFILTLEDIINNNRALAVFIEFMTSVGGECMLFFYLNIEGFRVAAEQQIKAISLNAENPNISSSQSDLEPLRKAANIIYNQYLSEKATSRVKIESDILKRCQEKIKSKNMSSDVFDEVQARVYQLLHGETYYRTFIQSKVYEKLLDDLGFNDTTMPDGDNLSLDDDLSTQADDTTDDSVVDSEDNQSLSSMSLNSSRSNSPFKFGSAETIVTAQISQTGIIRESEKTGKSYAVFLIRVTRVFADEEEVWDVYRRYSDFHDLQMLMAEKLPHFHGPSLPPKSMFKNMSEEFLEKRRRALDSYLQTLLNPDLWEKNTGVKDYVMKFLAKGMWEKHKSDLARKMDTIVNPLKTSVNKVGHVVKHAPDGIKSLSRDGITKLRDSVGPTDNSRSPMHGHKVAAGLDLELEENIPLRIMLLLMDEVFDLRHKNQWLRRQIVRFLKQLIKTAMGDRINKKIIDHVDWMTSPEQVAEYIKSFRDSFWPEGFLAEPRPERDANTVMRTRVVCRTKMLASIPDDLKKFLGAQTVRMGVTRVFDMFQFRSLNRRLVYVILEGVIETLFPENKFKELFRKMHSQSSRLKATSVSEFSMTDFKATNVQGATKS